MKEILRYRARGDEKLKLFLESNGHLIQNEIIESCNQILLKRIVNRMNSAQCYSILADETADIANIEQVAFCARYLDKKNMIIKEEFIQFIPTIDTTGKGLAT